MTAYVTVKIAAYHSSDPSHRDVYHDQHDCPTGQKIPARNIVSGTGGYPKCEHCAARD